MDDHEIEVRDHEDVVAAGASGREDLALEEGRREMRAARGDPPQVAVSAGLSDARVRAGTLGDPLAGDQVPIAPLTAAEVEEPEAGHVARGHPERVGGV